MVEVAVQNPHRYRLLELPVLRQWLEAMIASIAADADSFGLRFVDDDEIRELNRRYRGKDTATDVLSFPGSRRIDGYHLGDVVLSVPRARQQAAEHGLTVKAELRQLVLHGLLHCLGYDHDTDSGEMDAIELSLRERWLANVD